jgi:hypothetical protein
MAQVQYQGVARYLVLVYLLLLVCLWPRASFDKNSFCSHESNILLLLSQQKEPNLLEYYYYISETTSCARRRFLDHAARAINDVTKI